MATVNNNHEQKEPIIIYAFEGSHYVFKVLSALQSRNINHFVTFVDEDDVELRSKQLPSGGQSVPEMTIGHGPDKVIITDSEKILHYLDENFQYKNPLFPSEKASEISQRASEKTLAAMVSYYNIVEKKGYKRSYQREIREDELPKFFFPKFIANAIINHYMKPERKRAKQLIQSTIPGVDTTLMRNEPAMRSILVQELKHFQDFLSSDPAHKYLIEDSDQPTAADFSVYAQIVRLIGGGTSDSEVYASLPELRNDTSLNRLREWYDNMKENIQVQYLGKEPPQALLE